VNGSDVNGRPRGMWIIDFGIDMTEAQSALYEAPFFHVELYVKPARMQNNRAAYRERWWLHVEPRPAMREALSRHRRFIGTTRHSKHRLFAWLFHPTLPDSALIAIARDDDYAFGVLHSRVHELWARATGTQVREVESGFRYTPTTTFETFPWPWPLGTEPKDDSKVLAIAEAAGDLVQKRDAWLNPPGATESELAQRSLTSLYNQRPAWLDLAHRHLDEAVIAAYRWTNDPADSEILERLLAINLERESV